MDNQHLAHEETAEQPSPPAPSAARALSDDQLLLLFLGCTLVGFIAVLIGFTPLVVLAMIGPVVAVLF